MSTPPAASWRGGAAARRTDGGGGAEAATCMGLGERSACLSQQKKVLFAARLVSKKVCAVKKAQSIDLAGAMNGYEQTASLSTNYQEHNRLLQQMAKRQTHALHMTNAWVGAIVFLVVAGILSALAYYTVLQENSVAFWLLFSAGVLFALIAGTRFLLSDTGGFQVFGQIFGY